MEQIPVTELDFYRIKENIKSHFADREEFSDWNFEGSGLNFLIDVLAYNTQINALNSHLAINESFLSSAQLRNNVVSQSKLLGYLPRSTIGASTTINIIVPAINTEDPELTITIERGHSFTASNQNGSYTFLVTEDKNSENYDPVTQSYTFNNVEIKEGTIREVLARFDGTESNQRFEMPDENIDLNTLKVYVQTPNGDEETPYERYDKLSNLDGNSLVYFVQESLNGTYEIYFGDGVIGNKPINGSIIKAEYFFSSGPEANQIGIFSNGTSFEGNPNVTIQTNGRSSGGALPESIESIRFNAPLSFVTQERAVTADDYKTLIRKNFANIQTISVWGGETEPVPKYGRVYICIKPTESDFLTDAQESQITEMLKEKNIVTVTPEFVNPDYTRLQIELFYKYNPRQTSRSLTDINRLVFNEVEKYNDDVLNQFDGVFRYSNFLRRIDSVDPGILNSFARIYLQKSFTPQIGQSNDYEIQFSGPLYVPSERESIIKSSTFNYRGLNANFRDEIVENSGIRNIFLYTYENGTYVKSNSPIGQLNSRAGTVNLNNFIPDTNTPIRIEALPNSYNVAAVRNQLIDIDLRRLTIDGEIDTIAVGGSSRSDNYNTIPRFK